MPKKDRYPPRYEPYYLWGVGWFIDTRYMDKFKGFLGGCLGWFLVGFIILGVWSCVANNIGNYIG